MASEQERIAALEAEVAKWRELAKAERKLSELRDKLLVCYRVRKNPGSVIDNIESATIAVDAARKAAGVG